MTTIAIFTDSEVDFKTFSLSEKNNVKILRSIFKKFFELKSFFDAKKCSLI